MPSALVFACCLADGVRALRDGDEDVARPHARALLKLVLVLLVEIADRLRFDRDLRGNLAFDELLNAHFRARVVAHRLERHLLRGERLLELLLVWKLRTDLRDLRLDLGVRHSDLARLRFLDEQRVANHVVEHTAVHAVSLIGGHRTSRAPFESLDRVLELGAC